MVSQEIFLLLLQLIYYVNARLILVAIIHFIPLCQLFHFISISYMVEVPLDR